MLLVDETIEVTDTIYHQIATVLATEKTLAESFSSPTPGYSLPKVAFIGTQGVGKTSTIESVLWFGSVAAPIVNKEKIWSNIFVCVDTPAYDLEMPEDVAIQIIQSSDIVVQIFDIDATIRRSDLYLSILVRKLEKPCVFALNKADLYQGLKLQALLRRAVKDLRADILLVSAKTHYGRINLVRQIIAKLSGVPGVEAEHLLKILYERILENNEKLRRRVACEKIIREKAHEAAEIGASNDPSGARLLSLHALMIQLISELFNEKTIIIAPSTLDTKASFFLNATTQSLKEIFPKGVNSLTSIHAMLWTNRVGQLAIDYFEQIIDDSNLSPRLKSITRSLQKGDVQ